MTREHAPGYGIELARHLAPVRKTNPLLWVYHWRYEILGLTALPYALVALVQWLGPLWSAVALAGAFNWVFYWRAARRHLRDRLRVIVVQHRLRSAFTGARVCTFDGRRPAILWTRPRAGEVLVTLFCPAGLGFERIHEARGLLAQACFTTEAYVYRHPRYANLVTVAVCTPSPRRKPGRTTNPTDFVTLRAHS